jgi:hypothetical protein
MTSVAKHESWPLFLSDLKKKISAVVTTEDLRTLFLPEATSLEYKQVVFRFP